MSSPVSSNSSGWSCLIDRELLEQLCTCSLLVPERAAEGEPQAVAERPTPMARDQPRAQQAPRAFASFTDYDSGPAHRAAQSLRELAAGPAPDADAHGVDVAMAALSRAEYLGESYAYDGAPTSPHPGLTGNTAPGRTPLTWLRERYKCNQFVGDVLAEAGMAMPTFRMRDGSLHYMHAEALPTQSKYFARVTSESQLSVGDVLVHDYPGKGANTAHTEVVTGRDARTGVLFSTGAHGDGAYERDWSPLLRDATYNPRERCWDKPDGSRIYALRPIRKLVVDEAKREGV